jgi:hypothetical protein
MLKKIGWSLLIALVAIQFIRPAKNQTADPQPYAIQTAYPVPDHVSAVLKKACNDCHTNNSRYPWYASIQPVYWWLDHHIEEGKEHLNFDEYTNKRLRTQFHKMEEVIEQIKEGEMPLNSYTWTHGQARLTQSEKEMLTGWAQQVMDTMKARYPIDSLEKPKKKTAQHIEHENREHPSGALNSRRKSEGAERHS